MAITISGTDGVGVTGNVGALTAGTAVASTSGTSIDFTGIPSFAKRITVMFNAISSNGTSNFLVQLGTSAGIQNTGYTAYSYNVAGPASASYTTGFGVVTFNSPQSSIFSGQMTLLLVDNSNNWISTSSLASNGPSMSVGGGTKTTLGAVLDRVRITTVNGTDTFDAGSINILFE
jgi:hypothetical protein